MNEVRVIEIKKSVFENNEVQADLLRDKLRREKTFMLNLMSSPGSGKTTTVLQTLTRLSQEFRIGVLEADIDSTVDAEKVIAAGFQAVQLQTGGLCHLDANMALEGIEGLNTENLDAVILENVGNLVCPAEFDTGAAKNAMILSVPEGDDKPLKYPLMFSTCDALIINKIDCIPYFNFDMEVLKKRVLALNPSIAFFEISAKTGQGMDAWVEWLRTEILNWNQQGTI